VYTTAQVTPRDTVGVIEPDEKVRVTNRGGEGHTFTEVSEQFGGGRVAGLNGPLGLTALPQCVEALAPAIPPGNSVEIKDLSAGTHYFQCCIHPWMHAVIEVQAEKKGQPEVKEDHGSHGNRGPH